MSDSNQNPNSESSSITLNEFMAATTAWGGAMASAMTDGAKRYTAAAEQLLATSGQKILTETQKFELFAAEQGKAFRDAAHVGLNWGSQEGSKGIFVRGAREACKNVNTGNIWISQGDPRYGPDRNARSANVYRYVVHEGKALQDANCLNAFIAAASSVSYSTSIAFFQMKTDKRSQPFVF